MYARRASLSGSTLAICFFLLSVRGASGQEEHRTKYGLDLVGKDPYQGLPAFYSAYHSEYPPGSCPPARPTSRWHRWYVLNPMILPTCRDAKLHTVERRVLDFETEADLKRVQTVIETGKAPDFSVALSTEHASTGKQALQVQVQQTVAGKLPTLGLVTGGDMQVDHWDNFRWIKVDLFNPTGKDLIVGLNKSSSMAQAGFGPTFVVKPGASTLACRTAEFNGYHYRRGLGDQQVFLFAFAGKGTTLYLDNVRLVQEVGEVLIQRGRLFDFGADDNHPSQSKAAEKDQQYGAVFPGWTGVSARTLYTKERGYGWEPGGKTLAHGVEYHRQACALINDFVKQCDIRFLVDLPNGKYGVWLLGNRRLHEADLSIQGQNVRPQQRKGFHPERFGYELDLIKGDSPWYRYALPRGYAEYSETTEVRNGQLAIGPLLTSYASRDAHLNALVVYPLADKQEAEKEIDYLKAITLSEALEAGHAWIQPALMEAEHYGGAHEEFLRPENTPALIRSLAVTDVDRQRGYLLFNRSFTEPIYFDTIPRRPEVEELDKGLQAAACPGQYVPLTVGVYPLQELQDAVLRSGELRSEDGAIIPASAVDVRVERYDERWVDRNHENATPYVRVPVYQVRRPALALETGLTRRFVADLRVPENTRPGRYRGTFEFVVAGKAARPISVTVNVLSFLLSTPDAYFAAPGQYHPLYVAYGFNVLKTDWATAKDKGLKGYLTAGPHPGQADPLLKRIDEKEFRQQVVAGTAGKMPRLFHSAYWATLSHPAYGGKRDPEIIDRVHKALPELDVMGATNPLFWLPSFPHVHADAQLRPTAENIDKHSQQFCWLADALQPTKELAGRFTFGLYLWRSGIKGRISYVNGWSPPQLRPETHGAGIYPVGTISGACWVIDGMHGANMTPTAGSGWAFFMEGPDGQPCPTRDFVNLREGITDYRYLNTLELAVKQRRQTDRQGPALQAAERFLQQLRQETDQDLTRLYAAWGPRDAGGENWYPKEEFRLSARRLDVVRSEVVKHLMAISLEK